MAIYMDHNATTPLRVEVRQAMIPYLEKSFGNTSSVHAFGQETAKELNRAREQIAAALGCRPEKIVFTGSGTEADNLAIKGVAYVHPGTHIISNMMYTPAANSVTVKRGERILTFYPRVAKMAKVDGAEEARGQLAWFKELCNDTWRRRADLYGLHFRAVNGQTPNVRISAPTG